LISPDLYLAQTPARFNKPDSTVVFLYSIGYLSTAQEIKAMAITRRDFIRSTATLAAASTVGCTMSNKARADAPAVATTQATSQPATTPATTRASDRLTIGVVGCGGMSNFHGATLGKYADILAVCDVDRTRMEAYNKAHAAGKADLIEDYRKVVDRKDINTLLIATPDHWHVKVAVEAMRAGKDIYCEKPLTLTIAESRLICKTVRETNRVFQVGTQQRSEDPFLKAVALVHLGRIGKVRQATVVIPPSPKGVDLKPSDPPPELNWDMWLGPAPKTPYIKERCHYNFRWWYDYSGGIMTDWGAHHVDIAQWAIAPDLPGPYLIEPIACDLPVPFTRGYPTVNNAFNTATNFIVKCTFANGAELFIRDTQGVGGSPGSTGGAFPGENGSLIEGNGGWIFITRGRFEGPAVDAMKDDPLPPGSFPVIKEPQLPAHERQMANFIDCVKTRALPISDVFSHTKHLNTCHLANIALRLGRKLRWDATAQEILNDPEADTFQSRAQRKGYEIS
jgi:predicted dehydrogenase